MGSVNSLVYPEEWAVRLQEQLDEPNKFKEICKVEYTNSRVLNNPYLTDASVISLGRGTAYTYQTVSETNETVTINQARILPQVIDRADLAQSTYTGMMELATRQAVLLNEAIETAVYANHAAFTDFGAGDVANTSTADTTQITVSATNIDDIIRAIKRTIRVANGESFLSRFGGFVVWRPADLEILEGFMQANGYATSDRALQGDVTQGGFPYMGLTHYSSNLLAANHVFAGVKNVYHLGILKDTYGQIVVDDKDPGSISGISVVSRVDYQVKVWTVTKPVLFDVNVA